jgi:hypothetical protein
MGALVVGAAGYRTSFEAGNDLKLITWMCGIEVSHSSQAGVPR